MEIRGKEGNRESHEETETRTWRLMNTVSRLRPSSPSARHGGLAGGGQFTLVPAFSEDPGLVGSGEEHGARPKKRRDKEQKERLSRCWYNG